MKNVPSGLRSLINKVDKLNVDNLALVPVDLSKPGHVVKNAAVKKTEYDELVKKGSNFKTTDNSD